MATVRIAARLPIKLYQRLEEHMTTNKLSLTEALVAAISSYFGTDNMIPLAERMSQVEGRLTALENDLSIKSSSD